MTVKRTLVSTALVAAALLPFAVPAAYAVSYYPSYTCHYRDISGACLNYKTSAPSHYTPRYTYGQYGNRRTFQTMFDAYEVSPSPWDNRYNNHYNFIYEDDDDDNYYYDDDDDFYKYYYDEDDDDFRYYRVEDEDDYYYDRYYDNRGRHTNYEYEHTRIYCDGRDCPYYRTR